MPKGEVRPISCLRLDMHISRITSNMDGRRVIAGFGMVSPIFFGLPSYVHLSPLIARVCLSKTEQENKLISFEMKLAGWRAGLMHRIAIVTSLTNQFW
ncbi:MAG: hypothetical protein M2R45_00977 [Verrucomicrobia subdivision 3 bacterium]|nr:hypothetical protein [Limisphaerales bacterium]MCS1414644.1 hypothetical protein [Limisphaerales bacterium]